MVKLDAFKAHMLHGALMQYGGADIEALTESYLERFPGDAAHIEELARRILSTVRELR